MSPCPNFSNDDQIIITTGVPTLGSVIMLLLPRRTTTGSNYLKLTWWRCLPQSLGTTLRSYGSDVACVISPSFLRISTSSITNGRDNFMSFELFLTCLMWFLFRLPQMTGIVSSRHHHHHSISITLQCLWIMSTTLYSSCWNSHLARIGKVAICYLQKTLTIYMKLGQKRGVVDR